jgi:hypothetical protein
MQFSIEELGKPVLSGEATEYQIEVDHGGFGGQLDDGMLVSAIVRTVKRLGSGPNQWESAATIFLSLDRVSAEWLAGALLQVTSGEAAGLRRMFAR